MAVDLTRIIIILLLLSSNTYSQDEPEFYEKRALELAQHRFEIAKNSLNQKINECEKIKTVVPSSLLIPINLTMKELKIALFVLNNRAEDLCEKDMRGNFVIATSIYRTTAEHYRQKGKEKESLTLPYSEDLLFGHYWGKLELEAQYLEIDTKKRIIMENISQLKKPFHLFETLSKMESD